MTTDVPVGTPEPTEIPQGDATETPEVVEPGKDAETDQKAEKTEAEILREEKARLERQMQRRIDRKTREAYELRQQLEQERAAKTQQQAPVDDDIQPRYTEEEVKQRASLLVEIEQTNQRSNAIVAEGRKEFPDFDEKVSIVVNESKLFDDKGLMTPLMKLIAKAEKPQAVLHYLGSNPDVLEDLTNSDIADQAWQLAQIRADLAKPKEPPAKQVSKAPKPIEPVKPAGRASDEPPIEDTKAWIDWSNRQDALKRSRR